MRKRESGMLVKENKQAISDMNINREAPHIGVPFAEPNKKTGMPFDRPNPAISKIAGDYCPGPKSSYAKDLISRYPLRGE